MGLFENARTKYCDVIAENVTCNAHAVKKIKVYIVHINN